jgi:hypothetical protein
VRTEKISDDLPETKYFGFTNVWNDACNETNLMQYVSSVYTDTIPLHVLGSLVAHHQEVTMYICNKWYMLYVLVDCPIPTRPADSQLKRTTCTICCIYTLLLPDDGQLASPKHVEAQRRNKLKIVHQVGFITCIYRDARSTKHKVWNELCYSSLSYVSFDQN